MAERERGAALSFELWVGALATVSAPTRGSVGLAVPRLPGSEPCQTCGRPWCGQ
jgi:hypothetical protein